MRPNNNSSPGDGTPGTSNNNTNNNMLGAQTVSIGNKDLMTYIPKNNDAGSSGGGGPSGGGGDGNAENDMMLTLGVGRNLDILDMNMSSSSRALLNREESLDDEVFNASLDVFLKDDQVFEDDNIVVSEEITTLPPLRNSNNNEGGGSNNGRKRKAHELVTEMSSLTNSSDCSAQPAIAAAAAAAAAQAVSSLHQQQGVNAQNVFANNLMTSISPLTAALYQQPGAATVTANDIPPLMGPQATAITASSGGNAFDNLFGFNAIPELAASHATAPPFATKPPPGGSSYHEVVASSGSSSSHANKKTKKGGKQKQAKSSASKPRPSAVKSSSSLHVSEDEHERLSRRSVRNIREQQRSHRIADRISELRTVLQDAGVQFKPDRYNTLVGVVNYIKTLQSRSKKLDEEHKVLLKTISGAGEMVNGESGFAGLGLGMPTGGGVEDGPPGTTTVQTFDVSGENLSSTSSDSNHNDEEMKVFVQGIDYRFIFSNCGVALAVASVDGRFVDCNDEWLTLTGYTRTELMGECKSSGSNQVAAVSTSTSAASTAAHAPPCSKSSSFPPSEICISRQHLSLFNLLGREDMETVYNAMSRMLRSAPPPSTAATRTTATSSSSSASDPNTSDSFLESSSGNEASSGIDGDNIKRYTVDHWAGRVKHTRRKDHSLQLNISLVRTDDGRPKFFNCALSEAT
jgi:PAS domain-containing protein